MYKHICTCTLYIFSETPRTSPPVDSLPEFRVWLNEIILCTRNGKFGEVHVLNSLPTSARKKTVRFKNCISIFSMSSPLYYIITHKKWLEYKKQFGKFPVPRVFFFSSLDRRFTERSPKLLISFIEHGFDSDIFFLQFLPGLRISLLSLNRNIFKEINPIKTFPLNGIFNQ